MKYAHSIDERRHSIKDHLTGVAEKASSYSVSFLRDHAYKIGFAHDIGKYADDFQKRLEGSSVKFEHSSCGAIELGELVKDDISKDMTYMLSIRKMNL